jgi:cbb3-type cytochrome oxidase subunit 1
MVEFLFYGRMVADAVGGICLVVGAVVMAFGIIDVIRGS